MKKTSFYVLLLLIINSIIYHRWLSFAVFTYSDWIFYFKESLADKVIPTVWRSLGAFNFGSVDVLLWKLPIYLLIGFFGKLGFDYNIAEKFIVFWPIIFGLSLSSFFLIKYITKSNIGAFIGSFVFSYSTYFLSIDSQGHQFLPAAFVFSTFAILFYLKLIEERKIFHAVVAGIFLSISGAYDLRSLYIVLGILALYFVYDLFLNFSNIKKILLKYLLIGLFPFLIFLLFSLYWVIPILFTGSFGDATVLGRQIFGSEFYNLQSSFTSFFPFWTGKDTAWFTVQQIPLFFWLYPLLAMLGLVVNRKNMNMVFFASIALFGIFLSKQADIPFQQIYSWLYSHFPGFNAFREASKFDFMIALSYSVLIGGFIKWVMNQDLKRRYFHGRYLFIFLLFIIFLWNGEPILTGEIKQLYSSHKIPIEYIEVKNLILNQPDYFRSFWINMNNHWPAFNNIHPEIEGAVTINDIWPALLKGELSDRKESQGKKMINALQSETVNRLLNLSSVKYVIIPLDDKETDSDIVYGFGETHEFYKNALTEIKYLKKVNNMPENILVYENTNFRPHIYLTSWEERLDENIPYEKIKFTPYTPSEYRINLSKLKNPVWLNFSENYHPDWKLRVGNFAWYDVFYQKNYFLFDSFHKKNIVNFNSYYINPQEVCSQYQCHKNKDGSYNLELTLYFKPQSYLYLGMIISGSVLFLSITYLIYYGAKKIQQRKK